MTFINAIVTERAPYSYSTDVITEAAGAWLASSPTERALFQRLSSSTRIERRAFAIPLQELIGLAGPRERTKIFNEVGASMLSKVIRGGIDASGLEPSGLHTLLMTSCSVPSIPSIDTLAIAHVGLSPAILRVPIFQYGCAGGAIGLSLAQRLSQRSGYTMLTSVELCSLVHQPNDLQGGAIVGAALFGDGAASVVLSERPGLLEVVSCQSYLIPQTGDLMGYAIHDDGPHLHLDREIPHALLEAAPRRISDFLGSLDLCSSDIKWWIFHPGGAKILSSLEETFELPRERTKWGWDSLRENGNMSSASILYALKSFVDERPYRRGDLALMLGIGPGLTLQVNLLRCHG
jgi:alkylresorcinol/alkylpyrone synthase